MAVGARSTAHLAVTETGLDVLTKRTANSRPFLSIVIDVVLG